MKLFWYPSLFLSLACYGAGPSYVPDSSCPFTRWGKDVTLDTLSKDLVSAAHALRPECPEAANAADAIERYRSEHESQLKEIANQNKSDVPGFRKVTADCRNYNRVLNDEYVEVRRRIASKLSAPPGDTYAPCFDPKISPAEALTSAEQKYSAALRSWKLDCGRMRQNNSEAVQTGLENISAQQFVALTQMYTEQVGACLEQNRAKGAAQTVIASIVQAAALASTLEPTSLMITTGVRASSQILKLAYERLRSRITPPKGVDSATDHARRVFGCLALAASEYFSECRKKTPPVLPPPNTKIKAPMVDFIAALEDIENTFRKIQSGSIQSVLDSSEIPHPLDLLKNQMKQVVPLSIHGRPASNRVPIKSYLSSMAAKIIASGSSSRSAQYRVMIDDSNKLERVLHALNEWEAAAPDKAADKQRALILAIRGTDPAKPSERPAKGSKPNRPADLTYRYWRTIGLSEPLQNYLDWRTKNPDRPLLAYRETLLSAPATPEKSPPAIDESAATMQLAYTEFVQSFKPTLKGWLQGLRPAVSAAERPPSSSADKHFLHLPRRQAAPTTTLEPSEEEQKILSARFDAEIYPSVQVCTYLAPPALLAANVESRVAATQHFESRSAPGGFLRIGVSANTSEDYAKACRPLACSGSGLPLFERQIPASNDLAATVDAAELSRFKTEYCKSLDTVTQNAVRLKETYLCFRSICPPPPGDPSWKKFSCAQEWEKKYRSVTQN